MSLDSDEICPFSDRLYECRYGTGNQTNENLIEVEAFIQFLTNSTFTLISLFNGHLSY